MHGTGHAARQPHLGRDLALTFGDQFGTTLAILSTLALLLLLGVTLTWSTLGWLAAGFILVDALYCVLKVWRRGAARG